MTPEDADQLSFANQLANLAGPIALRHFRQLASIDDKPDHTPVTVADREIEAALREHIERHRPNDGILGEEYGGVREGAEHVWVIDPIDGTKSFATGNPLFGTLIGLLHRGKPVVGVIDAPALGERYLGSLSGGSFRNDDELHTRRTRNLTDAVLTCTTPGEIFADPGHTRLRQQVRWTQYGGDCLAYAFLAAGHCDVVVDRGLKPHDWCALVPVIEQAGGCTADWQGRPLRIDGDGTMIATATPDLMIQTVKTLAN